MFERYGIYALVAGIVLVVFGYVWLVARAWRTSWRWGLAVLIPPLALIFLCFEWRRTAVPATVMLLGLILAGATLGLNIFLAHHMDLGPRERVVDGQVHITLTGWDKTAEDYAVLATKPDTVVLQMANKDVTDETLQFLTTLDKLQELDLNDTQITDEGLVVLSQLPHLRVLRVRGTGVTNQGFRDHLYNMETLHELDARDTSIASKTLREWKNAKKDRRRYLK